MFKLFDMIDDWLGEKPEASTDINVMRKADEFKKRKDWERRQ